VLSFQDNTLECRGLIINNLISLLQNLVENAPEGKGWVSMVSLTFRSYHSVISDHSRTILVYLFIYIFVIKQKLKKTVEKIIFRVLFSVRQISR